MRDAYRRRSWRPPVVLAAGSLLVAGLPPALAPVAAVAAVTPAAVPATQLTPDQALVAAHRTGKPVEIPGSTTDTTTITAEPNGSFRLSEALQPVRKRVGGVWTPLDATLRVNPDGTVGPAVSTASLILSGGGGGPLARISDGGTSFAMTLPAVLPAPDLSGPTATYREVAPGVDLVVTADDQGGFSEVLVVKNAAAAASPLVRSLELGTDAVGLTLATGRDGSITGTDAHGHVRLTAPAPMMWDSSVPKTVGPKVTDRHGRVLDGRTGLAADSSAAGPGEGAKHGWLAVKLGAHGIGLGLDAKLMADKTMRFPLYVDPSVHWNPTSTSLSGYAVVGSGNPTHDYWKSSPSGDSDLQSGLSPDAGDTRRTLLSFTIPSVIFGSATAINTAELNIYESWAWNCTAQKVDIYAPTKDLNSTTAAWNDWGSSTWGSQVDQENEAHGYSGCDADWFGFDVKSAITTDAHTSNSSQTFLIKADNEGTTSTWKRFEDSGTLKPYIDITYNRPPSTPTGLKNSVSNNCTGATIGDSSVSLYGTFSDPDGGLLGEDFKLWKTSNSAIVTESNPGALTATSPASATPYSVAESWFATNSGGVPTSYSFQARTWDFGIYSNWSGTCSFTWDPTRTGAPTVTPPATSQIGQPATFTVAPPGSGTVPTSYMVQLNAAPPFTVAATAGSASFQVAPTRFTNTITVTGLSSGSNVGDSDSAVFNADPATPAVDGDLTGDGWADVLFAGGSGTPAGLWLATGDRSTGIVTTAANIGSYGNGVAGDDLPSDFTGDQVMTGHFTGTGLQDVLFYAPTGANAGGGGILAGNGDGSTILADQSGVEHTISGGDLQDVNGDSPVQLANMGNTSGQNLAYPDLLGISGDAASGWYLDYYPDQNGLQNWAFPTQLTTATPTGGTDWNNWTLTSAQLTSGATDLYLWNRTTGDLYAWTAMSFDLSLGTFTYTQKLVKAAWSTSASSIVAADINGDGTPDVAALTGASVVVNLITGLTGTPTVTAQAAQTVNTAAHTWLLDDGTAGAVTTPVKDTSGTLGATGSGNATWNTGGLFDPDAQFDGTNSMVATATKAVTTTGDFTVSAWVKPLGFSGDVLSQNVTNTASLHLWPSATNNSWQFAMSRTDVSGPVWDTVASAANTVQLGAWVHLTATYKSSTHVMTLYVNDLQVAAATHTVMPSPSDGAFVIGAHRTSSTAYGSWFKGEIADVQTWGSIVSPALIADYEMVDHSGTTAADKSGLAHTCTLAGGYTWYTTGHTGHAGSLAFNGTTGYGTANAALVNTGTSFSLTAWVKLTDTTAQHTVVSQQGSYRSPFYLQYDDATNKWQFNIDSADVASPTWYTIRSKSLAVTNTWVFLAATYDAATHTGRLYVNGTLEATKTNISTWNSTSNTWIGRSNSTWWQGSLDSVRVYQGSLSAQQVTQVMGS